MIISLRLSDLDYELVKRSAKDQGLSVSSFIREAAMDRIECRYLEILEKTEVRDKEEKE